MTLREGRLESIDLRAIDGIISFPSLHASVAVIVPFTLRWNKLLFWPIVVLDGLMMVSAVPSGNHYLSDVVVESQWLPWPFSRRGRSMHR